MKDLFKRLREQLDTVNSIFESFEAECIVHECRATLFKIESEYDKLLNLPIEIMRPGTILEVMYSDGPDEVKVVEKNIICRNIDNITDNDIAVCEFSPAEISKIKIKGVWLDYKVKFNPYKGLDSNLIPVRVL